MKFYRTQTGFSLIEMMIAMTIGSLVCLGAYKAYYLINPQLGYQSNLIHLQQNIRLLDTLLGNTLKFRSGLGVEIMDYHPDSAEPFQDSIKSNTPILKIVQSVDSESVYFFIKDTKRFNTKSEPLYALYQYSGEHSYAELLEGVEAIQYLVGIPNEKGIAFYLYTEVDDKTQIKMIRIQIQFVSLDKKLQKTHIQDFTIGNLRG